MFWCELTYESVNVTNGRVSLPSPTRQYMLLRDKPNNEYILEEKMFNLTPATLDNQTSSHDKLYRINKYHDWYLQNYLDQIFNGGWSSGLLGETYEPDWKDVANPLRVAPSFGQQIHRSSDVPRAMDKIAESMSEAVRTSPVICEAAEPCLYTDDGGNMSVNSISMVGEVYVDKAYIQVRWVWLALPIGLVVLSTVSLALVILSTSQDMAWKSSGTAAFFYRLQGWDNDETTVPSPEGMLARTENLRGRMVEEDGTLYFIRPKEAS